MDRNTAIGKAKMNAQPREPFILKLKPGALSGDILKDRSIEGVKIGYGAIETEHIQDGCITVDKLDKGIGNAVFSMVMQNLNKIWAKIEEITGEQLQKLSFNVTPRYFISEAPVPVHISASSLGNNGIFDYIAFYINGVKVTEASGVENWEFDTEISETSEVKYEATVLGNEYTDSTIIVHYNSYWLGAGQAYTDVMDISHLLPITAGLRGNYDVTFSQGDYLFIILSRSLRDQFIRADMNGFEIPFTETVITLDAKEYCVLKSENPYRANVYNIDING